MLNLISKVGFGSPASETIVYVFFERASEFAISPHCQTTPNPLFLEHFRRKLRSIPLLAQALNRTSAENCKVVREVCF